MDERESEDLTVGANVRPAPGGPGDPRTAGPRSRDPQAAQPRHPHVVVIGCGFGGLAAARRLADRPVRVTVIDRANHHLFQPLLYQVATGGLSAPAIASPIRHVLRRARNVETLMAEVRSIDPVRREVRTDRGRLRYDGLIIAAGAVTHWFGHDDWPAAAPGLKTLDDALDIRRRVLAAFEAAESEIDPATRRQWLTFAVVGGGPTGVELAGTLAEIARHTLSDEFRRIDPASARVLLVEGGPRVLPSFGEASAARAQRQLERIGVEVRTGCKVTGIDAGGLSYTGPSGEATRVATRTVLWAAGVRAHPMGADLAARTGATVDRGGRLAVAPDLSLPGWPGVFVVGDMAQVTDHQPPVPGVAPAAKQMGRRAADNLLATLARRPTRPFRYVDYGALATIGRNAAVAEIGRVKLSGYPAWLFWLFVHVVYLIGFRNRIVVMTDWAWSWLTFERYSRIIVGPRARG